MTLPRVLIIDDQFGGATHQRENRQRANVCQSLGLRDVTGDVSVESVTNPVAEAVFERGQRVEDGHVGNDISEAMRAIRKGWSPSARWALLMLDLHFKTGPADDQGRVAGIGDLGDRDEYFGLQILEHVQRDPDLRDLPVLILSGETRDGFQSETELRFARGGALGFLGKDVGRMGFAKALRDHGLITDGAVVTPKGIWVPRTPPIVLGSSVPLLKALREARLRAEKGSENVLLLGEAGTGKELFAQYVHTWSPKRNRVFETLLVRETGTDLVADRLFGHEKGAFTGASSARAGAAERANGGTLFIDEFGDVPPDVLDQFMRLLAVDQREVRRIGANESRTVDLQVVLATNKADLRERSDFRDDILDRVGIPVEIPPLRERLDDLDLLVTHFVAQAEATYHAERRIVTDEAMARLRAHGWPGNVRELIQTLDRAVAAHRGLRVLVPDHLVLASPTQVNVPDRSQGSRVEDQFDLEAHPSEHGDLDRESLFLDSREGAPSLSLLAELMEGIDVSRLSHEELRGVLPELENAFARLLVRLLGRAMDATRHPTSRKTRYTVAVNLLLGPEHERRDGNGCKTVIRQIGKHARDPDSIADLLVPPLDEKPIQQELSR